MRDGRLPDRRMQSRVAAPTLPAVREGMASVSREMSYADPEAVTDDWMVGRADAVIAESVRLGDALALPARPLALEACGRSSPLVLADRMGMTDVVEMAAPSSRVPHTP